MRSSETSVLTAFVALAIIAVTLLVGSLALRVVAAVSAGLSAALP